MLRRAFVTSSLALPIAAHARAQDRPAAPSPEDTLRAALSGTWLLAVPEATARQRIDTAIERCVGQMNYFVQSVARDQLRSNTPLNRRFELGFPPGQITIVFDDNFRYTLRPGARQTFPLPAGGTVDVRQYYRGGAVEQYFETTLGRRWNVYRPAANGQMSVTATQQGPMMPAPMRFELTYRRA